MAYLALATTGLRFQKNWRGLETPRHLVLFNWQSLRFALTRAGFFGAQDKGRPSACIGMYKASYAMQHGHLPYESILTPKVLKLQTRLAAIAEAVFPSRQEFLTVAARKAE